MFRKQTPLRGTHWSVEKTKAKLNWEEEKFHGKKMKALFVFYAVGCNEHS